MLFVTIIATKVVVLADALKLVYVLEFCVSMFQCSRCELCFRILLSNCIWIK